MINVLASATRREGHHRRRCRYSSAAPLHARISCRAAHARRQDQPDLRAAPTDPRLVVLARHLLRASHGKNQVLGKIVDLSIPVAGRQGRQTLGIGVDLPRPADGAVCAPIRKRPGRDLTMCRRQAASRPDMMIGAGVREGDGLDAHQLEPSRPRPQLPPRAHSGTVKVLERTSRIAGRPARGGCRTPTG